MNNQPSVVTIWPPGWPGELTRATEAGGHSPTCTELAEALLDHAPDDARYQTIAYWLKQRAECRALLDITKDAEELRKITARLVLIGRELKARGLPKVLRRAKP